VPTDSRVRVAVHVLHCAAVPPPVNDPLPLFTTRCLFTKMMNAEESNDAPGIAQLQAQYYKFWRVYQHQLDRITPFVFQRWGATAALLGLFILRIVWAQGVSLLSVAFTVLRC
jgi:hypothetical protein